MAVVSAATTAEPPASADWPSWAHDQAELRRQSRWRTAALRHAAVIALWGWGRSAWVLTRPSPPPWPGASSWQPRTCGRCLSPTGRRDGHVGVLRDHTGLLVMNNVAPPSRGIVSNVAAQEGQEAGRRDDGHGGDALTVLATTDLGPRPHWHSPSDPVPDHHSPQYHQLPLPGVRHRLAVSARQWCLASRRHAGYH